MPNAIAIIRVNKMPMPSQTLGIFKLFTACIAGYHSKPPMILIWDYTGGIDVDCAIQSKLVKLRKRS
jgi:hypothetical protein